MTFPLFEAFQAEWRLRPPVHWLAAAFMGYKPPKAGDGPNEAKAGSGDRPKGGEGGRSLKRDFPGGVIR